MFQMMKLTITPQIPLLLLLEMCATLGLATVLHVHGVHSPSPPCSEHALTFGRNALTLNPGQSKTIRNATFICDRSTGQFQVRDSNGYIAWQATTKSDPKCGDAGTKCAVIFQGDGNLVDHGFAGEPLWAANTWDAYGSVVKELAFQSVPPYVQVFSTKCQIMWWSNPSFPPPGPVDVAKFPVSRQPGLTLYLGQSIDIKNVSLTFTSKGNIQINKTDIKPQIVLWETKTHCIGNCTLDLQNDGNFILHHWKGAIHNSSVSTVWATWTYGENEGVLVLQDTQPYLHFDSASGTLLWSSMGLANFSHSNLGGVYYPTEDVNILVGNLPGGNPSWAVYNYWGAPVENGTLSVDKDGTITVKPKTCDLGYYDLVIENTFNTSFVIVADNSANWALGYTSSYGVGTHFSQKVSPDMMPLIKRLGTTNIRDNTGAWAGVEKVKGVYNFSENAAWVEAARQIGLTPTAMLAFSNPLYTWGPSDRIAPYNNTGYEAYSNFAAACVKQYPWIKSWEVWNEYIGSFVSGPAKANISLYYTQMIKAVYPKIKAINKDIEVLGGAAEDIPLPTFEEMFEQGLLDNADALVIHPYGYKEGIERKLERLNDMMSARAKTGKPLPVMATEWSDQEKDTFEGRRIEANYAARLSALMRAGGVARMHYFLMSDFQSWPRGMVRAIDSKWGKFAATPSFATYSTAINMLGTATYVARDTPVTSPAYVLQFVARDGTQIRVCWAAGPNATVRVTGKITKAVNIVGASITPPAIGGIWELPSDPVYLIGSVAINDADPIPIADSYIDFTFTQGAGNWQYGFFKSGSSDFEMAHVNNSMWVYFWQGPEPDCRVYDVGGVPGSAHLSVRRWISNVTDTVKLSGWVLKPSSSGTSISGSIYHNGMLVANTTATPGVEEFYNITLDVANGDKLDFALSGNGANVTYPIDDHCDFRVQIYSTAHQF